MNASSEARSFRSTIALRIPSGRVRRADVGSSSGANRLRIPVAAKRDLAAQGAFGDARFAGALPHRLPEQHEGPRQFVGRFSVL